MKGENSQHKTPRSLPSYSWATCMLSSCFTFHKRKSPFIDPEMMKLLSGVKLHAVTAALWP